MRGGDISDTVRIEVDDPESGSYHTIRSYFTNFRGPDAPVDITFVNLLVWSADPDADVDDIDFGALISDPANNSGFHVLALYDAGRGSVPVEEEDQISDADRATPGPVVEGNFAMTSTSTTLQGYLVPFLGS